MTRDKPNDLATSVACNPPAPPNGISTKLRGSWPFSVDTARIARVMFEVTIPAMPNAVSVTLRPRGLAIRSMA